MKRRGRIVSTLKRREGGFEIGGGAPEMTTERVLYAGGRPGAASVQVRCVAAATPSGNRITAVSGIQNKAVNASPKPRTAGAWARKNANRLRMGTPRKVSG